MGLDRDLWALSAQELVQGYSGADFTPVDVFESCWARLEQVNPLVNAVIFSDRASAFEAAAASAARWKQGKSLSSLDGVPLTVKDNINAAGMPTVWGSRLFTDFVPQADELPVAKIRQAGAVILGKSNVPEFTLHGYTDNLVFGTTFNPWDLQLTPGGSSGGAVAAVAAGIGPLALGTDGGGSIRRPASHTGLVGLKPSVGRVPRCDGLPVILHDCEIIGPIARTVADVETAMQIMGVSDARDPLSQRYTGKPYQLVESRKPCSILYIETFGNSPVDSEIAKSVAQAADHLAQLGHRVEHCANFTVADPVNEHVWPVIGQSGLAWLLQSHPGWESRINPALVDMARAGGKLGATQYVHALNLIAQIKRDLSLLFERYDMLMTPTAAALPWPANEIYPPKIAGREVGPRGHAIFTAFVNAAGLPALNLPCGPASSGLPIGFQLVGPQGADEFLCSIGREYEKAHPWADRWPSLPVD